MSIHTNTVLVVDVSEEEQIIRTVKRENNNNEQIKSIIASQMQREERLTFADNILNNTDINLTVLKQEIAKLHQQYLLLASKRLK